MHMSYMLINSSAGGYDVIMITMIKNPLASLEIYREKLNFAGLCGNGFVIDV